MKDSDILTPKDISYLLGETLRLHEFRKNKRTKSIREVISNVIVTQVIDIHGSSNKIIEMKLTEQGESNTMMSIIFDNEGNSIKNQDILKSKYVITK